MERGAARKLAIATLADVGLGSAQAERYPAELSGGMQKRVGLARAIAAEPEILFFDEPTTGLDPIMGEVINDLIVDCVRRLGATALTITHDMASARRIADRVAMIHAGRIVWCGPAEAVENSGNAVVDQFVHGRADGRSGRPRARPEPAGPARIAGGIENGPSGQPPCLPGMRRRLRQVERQVRFLRRMEHGDRGTTPPRRAARARCPAGRGGRVRSARRRRGRGAATRQRHRRVRTG